MQRFYNNYSQAGLKNHTLGGGLLKINAIYSLFTLDQVGIRCL